MKAVAYQKAGPITSPEALVDIELDAPIAEGHDLSQAFSTDYSQGLHSFEF
jgi:hypothetical protein